MKRITRLTAVALTAAAVAAPAAHAVPTGPDAQPADRVIVEPAPAPVVIDDGFDWASAAIGAGAAGGLVLLIGVGGSTFRHRHERIGVAR
jgi:hypothetical protein